MGGGGEVVRREERTVVNWFCTGVRGGCCGEDDSGSAHMAGITYKCPTDLNLSHCTTQCLGLVHCCPSYPMVHVGSQVKYLNLGVVETHVAPPHSLKWTGRTGC